jgi:hypothetical protein
MELLKRVGKWLTTSNISTHRKDSPALYAIDVKKLAKELNLV